MRKRLLAAAAAIVMVTGSALVATISADAAVVGSRKNMIIHLGAYPRNYCLDSNAAGRVYTSACNGGNNQKWNMVRVDGPTGDPIKLRNVATRLCLDVNESTLDHGAMEVYTHACNAGKRQYWKDYLTGNIARPGIWTKMPNYHYRTPTCMKGWPGENWPVFVKTYDSEPGDGKGCKEPSGSASVYWYSSKG